MQSRLSTVRAKLDAARTDAERRLLRRERTEITAFLAKFRKDLGFLQAEHEAYKAFAAANDVKIR